jgi:formylglycine-generating enzyme required for sulfatase activity
MFSAAPLENSGDMIYVPAGDFLMGTSEADARQLAQEYRIHPSLLSGETPQRKVHVDGFYIDRFPVTNAQYQQFVAAAGHRPPTHWKGKEHPKGRADWPVTNLGWHHADAYAGWAGKRLPTAAEWEKAARGTDGRRYPWGNEWDDQACRTDDGSSPQTPSPLPVGCFPKGVSPYGVSDLVGNVAQWTSTPSQPTDAKRGWAWYVVKGAGSAHHLRPNFRCAARNVSAHTSRRHSWLGFRCARDAQDAPAADKPPVRAPARTPPQAGHAAGPEANLYGRQPITLAVGQGHSAAISVPFFPQAVFRLNLPEQVGVSEFHFGWNATHTPIRWQINDERTHASYQCTFEDKATLTVTLEAKQDCVDFTIAIGNLTDKPFTRPASNTCFNNHGAPYFVDPERDRTLVWTDDGPVRLLEMLTGRNGEPLHGGWTVALPDQPAPKGGNLARHPLIAVVSRDRQWIVAQAYAQGVSVASNAHYTCLHTRPRWPDIPPGEQRALTGKLYFLKGGADELLARWRRDFHP